MNYNKPRLYAFGGDVKHGFCIPGSSAPPACSQGSLDIDSNSCNTGGSARSCSVGNKAHHLCNTGNSDGACCDTGNSAKAC